MEFIGKDSFYVIIGHVKRRIIDLLPELNITLTSLFSLFQRMRFEEFGSGKRGMKMLIRMKFLIRLECLESSVSEKNL